MMAPLQNASPSILFIIAQLPHASLRITYSHHCLYSSICYYLSPPALVDLVATQPYRHTLHVSILLRAVVGSISETGWDNPASQAASTEGRGERTDTALVVSGIRLVLRSVMHPPSPFALMCNLGTVPLAQ